VIIIGIDPGLQGALAAYDTVKGKFVWIEDLPTLANGVSGKKMINGHALRLTLKTIKDENQDTAIECIMEQVGTMPGQGISSAFNFGRGFGIIEGCIAAMMLPLHLVRPAVWKKSLGYTSDKEVIRADMIRHFPDYAEMLKRKMDADRAEAMALALYLLKRQVANGMALTAYNSLLLEDQ
jgi:crossover junction endodeoxyribonuclease RuvC